MRRATPPEDASRGAPADAPHPGGDPRRVDPPPPTAAAGPALAATLAPAGPAPPADPPLAATLAPDAPAPSDGSDAPAGTTLPADPAEGRYRDPAEGGPRPIGEGSFGRVLLVWDQRLEREVALKELSRPGRGREAAERFVREARVTARLDHPGIVPVHDLGRRPDGTWYYTMKPVRGRTLAEAVAAAGTLAARLELLDAFVDVCQAVAYAHSRGVLHRDLKPQNVMLGAYGETVVLDWGLARDPAAALDPDDPLATRAGAALGTPAYMSPEQAWGRVDEVDERSDVFGLGAVLYHLLSGRPPYLAADGLEALGLARAAAPPALAALVPGLPRELGSVVGRAMAPAPSERYPDPLALARDVRSWRAGGLVEAHRYGLAERTGRVLSRHGGKLLAGLAALTALLAVSVALSGEVVKERDRAEVAEEAARQRLAESLVARATEAVELGSGAEALVYGVEALAVREEPAARGAVVFGQSSMLSRVHWVRELPGDPQDVAWGPTGELAVLLDDRVLRFGPDGAPLPPVTGLGPRANVPQLEWSPSGRRFAVTQIDGMDVYEPALRLDGPVRTIGRGTLSPLGNAWDGEELLLMSHAHDGVGRYHVDREALVEEWRGPVRVIRALARRADGLVALGTNDHQVLFWRPGGVAPPLEAQGVGAYMLAFRPDGKRLAAVGEVSGGDGRIRTWDLDTGRASRSVQAHRGEAVQVGWSADGRWLVSAGRDRFVRAFSGEGLDELAALRIRGDGTPFVSLSPDGRRLAAAGEQRLLRVWALTPQERGIPPLAFERGVMHVGWEGEELVVVGADGLVSRFGPAGEPRGAWRAPEPGENYRLPLGDGSWLMAGLHGLPVVDPRDGRVLRRLPAPEGIWYMGPPLSHDGRTLFVASADGRARFVEVADGATRDVACDGVWGDAVWLPDDSAVITMTRGGPLRRVDRATGACSVFGSPDPEGGTLSLAPDGTAVVLANAKGLQWLSLPDGALARTLPVRGASGLRALWTPDGRHVILVDWRGVVQVHELEGGRLVAAWQAHRNRIWHAALDPTGRLLATGGVDHTARVWRLDALDRPRAELAAEVAARTKLRLVDGELR